MKARVRVNGGDAAQVSALDRGLAYGDGLFETIRFVAARAPLWSGHMARLAEGCARLGLPRPDVARLHDECARLVEGLADAVVKIILTRGLGERGYAAPADAQATQVVVAFAAPQLPRAWYVDGIAVRCCELRLAAQPALAGLKHINRLEQVLARREWCDPAVVEGLLFDAHDGLIGATAANAFVVIDGQLTTPAVERCGVAGVLRAAMLAAMPSTQVRPITRAALMRATEVFLVSSVRGAVPVRAIDQRQLTVGPATRAAQAFWQALGFVEISA